ncbi:hypothetical protein CLIB1444_01S08086 [[Candida] jaroonii]|uniref:Uncharacterized protein n=1 Tax=[Candida] jaroonii TaxID=467808 RepID=A0ACA9Y0P0_9ASCO|nr:hypothetical protein CLIB1444_01S08086 [[Candida] jaroonii]
MSEGIEVLSSEIFECTAVEVFKIPPGEITLNQWTNYESNTVWKGSLRLIEQESFPTEGVNYEIGEDASQISDLPILPIDKIRLKIELFNTIDDDNLLWGQVFYNPLIDIKDDLIEVIDTSPSNTTGEGIESSSDVQIETIQRTHSYRLFKIIVQIPGTNYSPNKQDKLIQVALGLKFDDKIDAYTFIERLQSYKKLFKSYVEQYNYDMDMLKLTTKQNDLSLNDIENINFGEVNNFEPPNDDADDNDDFGDFVS